MNIQTADFLLRLCRVADDRSAAMCEDGASYFFLRAPIKLHPVAPARASASLSVARLSCWAASLPREAAPWEPARKCSTQVRPSSDRGPSRRREWNLAVQSPACCVLSYRRWSNYGAVRHKPDDEPYYVSLSGAVGTSHAPRDSEDRFMPEKETLERAREDVRQGKAPTTQAGEFVREEMHHVREGKHGARSTKQAIAIGLSKARRAGVKLPPPPATAEPETIESVKSAIRRAGRKPSPRRAQAIKKALKREPHGAATPKALARQAKSAARRRSPAARSAAARRAAQTKGPAGRRAAARKAARTRQRQQTAKAT